MLDHRKTEIAIGDFMQAAASYRNTSAGTHLVMQIDDEKGVLFADYHSLWIAPDYLERYWRVVDDTEKSDVDMSEETPVNSSEILPRIMPVTEVVIADANNNGNMFSRQIADLISLTDELGSINKATKIMGISYSCAWNQLARVERWLGFTLFERQGPHGSSLTQKGREFTNHYEKVYVQTSSYADKVFAREFQL